MDQTGDLGHQSPHKLSLLIIWHFHVFRLISLVTGVDLLDSINIHLFSFFISRHH